MALPVRIRILILVFFTRFLVLSLATNLHFALEFMVHSRKKKDIAWCIRRAQNLEQTTVSNSTEHNYGPRYNWTKEHIAYMMNAYILGIIVSSVPAGLIAEYLGPFYIVICATFISTILNVSRVFLAAVDWKAVVILQFFLGLDLGFVVPSLVLWVARWAPPNERGIFVYASSGRALGISIMTIESRFLTPYFGWQGLFYYTSTKVLLFSFVLFFIGSNHPENHRSITLKELRYIKASQKGNVTYTRSIPPYGKILSSRAFWSLNILSAGFRWGKSLQFKTTPRFLHEFIGFTSKEVAYLDLFPYLGILSNSLLSAAIGDFIRKKSMFSDTSVVKCCVVFSHILPGLLIYFMPMAYCNAHGVFILLFLGVSLIGSATISVRRTTIDISPNYAGTISGFLTLTGRVVEILGLRIDNIVLKYDSGIIGWTIVFLIGGGCLIGTAVIFLFFGSDVCQWWNQKSQDSDTTSSNRIDKKDEGKQRSEQQENAKQQAKKEISDTTTVDDNLSKDQIKDVLLQSRRIN